MSEKWSPKSWRNKDALHMPNYQNEDHLNKTLNEISNLAKRYFDENYFETTQLMEN